jgi:ATPase subunit of ABC transporter with duplicated ATPase domains
MPFYQASREQQREAALQALDSARVERKRGERELRQQHERQQQRSASGRRQGKDSNQAKILLDMQKGRSESSAGRTAKRLEARRQQLDEQVREAAAAVLEEQSVILHAPTEPLPSGRRVLYWRDLRLPFGKAPLPDFELFGSRRVAVLGPNGCGKSSLLAVLAGRLAPLAGECRVEVPWAILDQHLHGLDLQESALEHLQRLAPGSAESLLRTRLVHLGLEAEAALAAQLQAQRWSAPEGGAGGCAGERSAAAIVAVGRTGQPYRSRLAPGSGARSSSISRGVAGDFP